METRYKEPETRYTERPELREQRATHSIPGLLRELREETVTLFQQEIALAKTELKEKASKISRNAIYLAVGGAIAFAGVIFLLVAAMRLITIGLVAAGFASSTAVWASPAILGFVVAAIGAGIILKARRTLSEEPLAPEKTLQSLKEDTSWTREKMKEA